MSELRYPNETREYRDAREALLKDEEELVQKVKAVAQGGHRSSRVVVPLERSVGVSRNLNCG